VWRHLGGGAVPRVVGFVHVKEFISNTWTSFKGDVGDSLPPKTIMCFPTIVAV
jgi:hypothetical protein